MTTTATIARGPVVSGTVFNSLTDAARSTGCTADHARGHWIITGKALIWAKPARHEYVFVGYLEHGHFDRLPVTCVDEDGNHIDFDSWLEATSHITSKQ